ncbi:MAG: tetratricopeptide repeat protein [Chloroflexota bacterium]|nr:tetratricopeptide repeat protein [Chloroflexota bacterium]
MQSLADLVRGVVEGFLRALPHLIGPLLPRRRKRSRPISVADFVSSGTKYHPPDEVPPRLRDFVTRKDNQLNDFVKRVISLLDGQNGKVVLWGDGGVGKSTLAYQAAASYAAKKPFGLVWVSADGIPGFSLGHFTQELATLLQCDNSFTSVCDVLRERPHVVVLDNADTIEDRGLFLALAQSFPARSRLLVTSRQVDQRFNGLGEAVEVDVMREPEALAYARRRADALDPPPRLTDAQLKGLVGVAGRNPEVIWWLLGYAQRGRLVEALHDLSSGGGLASDQKRGPGRVFGRTWAWLTLRERTALCVLSLLPQMSRDLLQDATGDTSIADTLDALWRWHLAKHDGTGQTWAVAGLTRDMARAKLYEVLDTLWGQSQQQDAEGRQAAAALAHFGASGAIQEVLDQMGHWQQRVTYGERCLSAARLAGDKVQIAGVAHHLAIAYHDQGQPQQAEKLYQESLALARELGSKAYVAAILHQLGNLAQGRGNLKEAEGLYQESLALARELGSKAYVAAILHQLGMLAQGRGDLKEAERLYQESLALARELKLMAGISFLLHQFGTLAQDRGELEKAEGLYQESLALSQELGNKSGIAGTLHQLGNLARGRGEWEKAERLYQESLALSQELGNKVGIAASLHQLGNLAYDRGDLKEAERLYQESLTLEQELGDKSGIAISLHQLGLLREQQEKLQEAEALLQEALGLFKALGSPYAAQAESALDRVRQKMGKDKGPASNP